MPLYEYKCNRCGKVFEELVLGNTTIKCPMCNARTLKRLISIPGPTWKFLDTKHSGGQK